MGFGDQKWILNLGHILPVDKNWPRPGISNPKWLAGHMQIMLNFELKNNFKHLTFFEKTDFFWCSRDPFKFLAGRIFETAGLYKHT